MVQFLGEHREREPFVTADEFEGLPVKGQEFRPNTPGAECQEDVPEPLLDLGRATGFLE